MKHVKQITLTSSSIETPLGPMIAIADEHALHLLDFIDRKQGDHKIKQLIAYHNAIIVQGTNKILSLISSELGVYFAGTLKQFTTPITISGSEFQQKTWHTLTTIPYGQTCSYAQEAIAIGNKKAARAVALANSNNILAIIIPCHRVIGSSGKLCGYASGITRKQWLITHEQQNLRSNTNLY
jgi:AraC family transcriptional regulator of adaptative response/methylated-DNA-[protein]-cysteine methyltransferase